ncbi:hypothetical protein C8R48DRAFT_779242 [Suillus tomentosus]|nr:hypothetical protein C8R48DRAFT_779242 [Suillus tomentosus]
MHCLPSRPAHLACRAQNKLSSKRKAKKKAHPTEVHSLTHRSPSIPALAYAGGSKTCSPTIPTVAIDDAIDAISGADADGEVWTEEDVLAAFSTCPLDALDDVAGEDDDAFSDTFTSDFTDDSDDPDAAKEMGKRPSKGTETFSLIFSDAIKERAHQHRAPDHWNESEDPLREWLDETMPRVAVSHDGVPLVLHVPNAINSRGKQSLTRTVRQFGSSVKLNKGQGADRKKRDSANSYRIVPGQLAGVFKLVSAWHAIGHTHDPPVISGDTIKTATHFSLATQVVLDLELLNCQLNALLRFIDPPQFLAMEKFAFALREHYPHVRAWSAIDGLLWEGRSFQFNRQTPLHPDSTDPVNCWVALNLRLFYEPGTIILLRGHILPHEVEAFFDGQRISIAHFTHESLWKALGLHLP